MKHRFGIADKVASMVNNQEAARTRARWVRGLLLGTLMLGSMSEGVFAEQRIYLFHNTNYIGRVNLTGTNYECCHSWIGFGDETGLANPVDWLAGWLYYSISIADVNPHRIYRTSTTTAFEADLLYSSSTIRPTYLVQDGFAGPLFFYDAIGQDLYRLSDIDGGGTPTLVFSNIGNITSLAIEPVSNYLYWTTTSNIQRVTTTGANHSTIVSGEGTIWAVAVDEINDKIYWSLHGINATVDIIRRANLDGTSKQTVRSLSGLRAVPMVVDGVGEKIYFADADSDTIRRCNTDGSGAIETIINQTSDALALEVGLFSCKGTTPYGDTDSNGLLQVLDVSRTVDCVKDLSYIDEDMYNVCDLFPCAIIGTSPRCAGDGKANVLDVSQMVTILKGLSYTCP